MKHKYTINVHANGPDRGPLPVTVTTHPWFVTVQIGEVAFFLDSLADAADLSERLSVAVSAAMAAPPTDLSKRLRSSSSREIIAEMTADEWEAQR